jgi:hypothetical protein
VVRLVKEQFVAVAVDAHIRDFKDAEVEFARSTDCVPEGAVASGAVRFITASGKKLERGELAWNDKTNWFLLSAKRALKAWEALPLAERKPGAISVPKRPPVDPKRAVTLKPPEGALVVRLYNRQLGRNAKGDLRYTVAGDYVPALHKIAPPSMWAARFAEASHDFLWITRKEWQAMMPDNPRKGQEVKVPVSLCERIFRFALEPSRGFTAEATFVNATAKAGQLRLIVVEAGKKEVRLRLEGHAILEKYRGSGSQQGGFISYRPSLLGYLAFDPAKKVFTRFDVVALGDLRGYPVGENLMGARDGVNPLGIAFELVSRPTPADFVSPKGLTDGGSRYNLKHYLGSANQE